MSTDPRPGRLLRWGLPRDPQAVPHLVAMTVAAVATILLTRGLLAASGYPQVGGGGLHIAHVLWGGLLMVAALVLLLSFAGPVVRPGAAIVAGAGLGLFIDEVGKFVTSNNDYFYQPAFAIMYAVLVLLMVGVHALHGRRPHHPAEHLAGAVDMAVAGVVGGFTTAARAKAHEQLAKAGAEVPGSAETTALLAAIPDDKYELYDPVEHGAELFAAAQGELRDRAVTGRVAVLVLPVYAAIALASAAYLVVVEAGAGHVAVPGQGWVSVGGVALGSVLMSVLVVTGLRRLGRDRRAAFRRFQRAVLVSVLLTQVFGFAVQQLAACLAVGVDLLLFGAIGVELHRLRPRSAAPRPSP